MLASSASVRATTRILLRRAVGWRNNNSRWHSTVPGGILPHADNDDDVEAPPAHAVQQPQQQPVVVCHHHFPQQQAAGPTIKRHYHTTPQPAMVLPLFLGCVAVAGGYVVYRKLQGKSVVPEEATRAQEAYRQRQHDVEQQRLHKRSRTRSNNETPASPSGFRAAEGKNGPSHPNDPTNER